MLEANASARARNTAGRRSCIPSYDTATVIVPVLSAFQDFAETGSHVARNHVRRLAQAVLADRVELLLRTGKHTT